MNATIYKTEITDLQISRFDPSNVAFLVFIENAGDAEVEGLDMDFTWLIGERWTLSGGMSFVDNELNRAHVYFDSLAGEDADGEIVDALAEHRVRLQSAVGKQIRARKTPILDFRPDAALRSAERIDDILREDRQRRGEA